MIIWLTGYHLQVLEFLSIKLSKYKMLVLISDLFICQRRKGEGWDGDGITLVEILVELLLMS